MAYIIPAEMKKKITFKRLTSKNVLKYEIYGSFKDSNSESGIKTILLDTIENPAEPTLYLHKVSLEPNVNATWELPDDAYFDRDHQFRIYINDVVLSPMCYKFNRRNKLITLDVIMKEYHITDKVELEYYRDLIVKEYLVEDDCTIKVKPIFSMLHSYGDHNVII